MDLHESTQLQFLPQDISDHSRIFIKFDTSVPSKRGRFAYFNMWSSSPRFQDIVNDGWNKKVTRCPMAQICKKLQGRQTAFRDFNRKEFGAIGEQVDTVRHQLPELPTKITTDPVNEEL